MQETNVLPPRPDVPVVPPRKPKWHSWLKYGLAVFIGLAILGVLQDIGDTTSELGREGVDSGVIDIPDETFDEPVDTNMETARLAWDVALSPSDQADLCDYYNTPPVGITPQMVRIYDSEANLGYTEAERVLGTLLAEKC